MYDSPKSICKIRFFFFSALATSFIGGLTAGLGQGFDLGTEWPGPVLTLFLKAVSGSFEPIHRFLTVLTSFLYIAVVVQAVRLRVKRILLLAGLALAFLFATAMTGRAVLLVLGGEIKPPLAFAVYPLNNSLALSAALTMALLWAYVTPQGTSARPTLFRGAAVWGFVASATGAYILGYHKIVKEPLQYSLIPSLSFEELPWALHLAAGFLATLLAVVAVALDSRRGFWHWAALLSALAQPATGIFMFFGASADPWAPGIQTAFHAAFAHLLVISAFVIYAKSRFGGRWTSPT